MSAPNIETIVISAKRRGFVFPASDIYGGLGSSWDYGSLGVELANNIKKAGGAGSSTSATTSKGLILRLFKTALSGNTADTKQTFSDPLVDCRACKGRFRLDKLQDAIVRKQSGVHPEAKTKNAI